MQNKETKVAFHWIVNILQTLNIPFQITGGLAAIIYGARRPLEDIDIDIPEECFLKLIHKVSNFILYGPAQFKDDTWDLTLMTLSYHGQLIDLSGAFYTKIFNKDILKWQQSRVNFSKVKTKKYFDLVVPVISKKELIFYKKILSRPVDLIDIAQIQKVN